MKLICLICCPANANLLLILQKLHLSHSQKNCFWLPPTVSLEDDSNVVLDEGADVEQHSWSVNGAETELYVICCVIIAEAEVVVMWVNPVGPCCFV